MATITTILGTDQINNSRSTINTNFTNLNSDKAEKSNVLELDNTDSFTPDADYEPATKKYVDDTVTAGGVNADTATRGIVEIATQAEIDADTGTGGTGATIVTSPDNLATSKYGTQLPSSDEKDALAGTGTPNSTNKYVTNDDTSASSVASKAARYDSSGDLDVPATPGGANKAASKTYVDALSRTKKLAASATQVDVRATDVETTLFSATVSADTLSTNNAIKVWIPVNDLDYDLDSVTLTFRLKYGSTTVATASVVTSGTSFDNSKGVIEAVLIANASTSAQRGIIKVNTTSDQISSSGSVVDFLNLYASGTATEDSTGALTLAVTYQSSDNTSGKGITTDGYIAEVVS